MTRRVLHPVILSLLALVSLLYGAAAQSIDTITAGGTVSGSISDTNSAPSYFFEGAAGETFTVRLETVDPGLDPVILLANADNAVIQTFSGLPGDPVIGGPFTLPSDGRFFLQVQGAGGTRGSFTMRLLVGDQPILPPTPTALPTIGPTLTAQNETIPPAPTDASGTAVPALPELLIGTPESAAVSADTSQQIYRVQAASTALLLELRQTGSGQLRFEVMNAASGEVVGLVSAQIRAAAFVLPAAGPEAPAEYRIVITFAGGSFTADYVLALSALGEDGRLISESGQTPPPAETTPLPISVAPENVDLLLEWDFTQFMMTNVSGQPVDVSTISFAGNNRRAGVNDWLSGNPAMNTTGFRPGACAGFRPLAYPDPPQLPLNCVSLAAWRSDDRVHFWSGSTFEVLIGGVTVATCDVSTGTCGVDIP
jgi:hypothetical protein